MQETRARAHSNVALVKYWGKSDPRLNLPAMPSLSLTLGGLSTTTQVSESDEDLLTIDGERLDDRKVIDWLNSSRAHYEIPPVRIQSESNFPTSSGLASSASGFAALAGALNAACELDLSQDQICDWARLGSASAARSIHGGIVAMRPEGEKCNVWQVLDEQSWDLSIVVAVTSLRKKAVPSWAGMAISRDTSPFYESWVSNSERLFEIGLVSARERDFRRLGAIADSSSRQMHAVMMSSEPPMIYWNSATLKCIETLQSAISSEQIPLFYTIDAGPQVKVVCPSEVKSQVKVLLRQCDGVELIIDSNIGSGMKVL